MLLSICVVSFNTRDLLERCLRAALEDVRGLAAEVVVVDNASADGSVPMVRRGFPVVRLIVNGDNRLFSAAQNQAIAASRGRYLLVLNADTEIRRGTVAAMLAYMEAHPRVGAMSGAMFFPDGRRQRTCARFTSYRLALLEYTVLGLLCRARRRRARDAHWYADWDRLSEREVDVVPGSLLLARREAIDATGGFDEQLRLYFSDDDLCRRLRRAGFAVAYAPVGAVIHVEGASARQVPRLARRLYFEDLRTYVRKHAGPRQARWLWLLTRPTYWALCLAATARAAAGRARAGDGGAAAARSGHTGPVASGIVE